MLRENTHHFELMKPPNGCTAVVQTLPWRGADYRAPVRETNKHPSVDNVMCFQGLTPGVLHSPTRVYADKYSSHTTLCRALGPYDSFDCSGGWLSWVGAIGVRQWSSDSLWTPEVTRKRPG